MTTMEATATSAAAAAVDTTTVPKKKTKPPLAPIPAALATAISVVQAATLGVLGRSAVLVAAEDVVSSSSSSSSTSTSTSNNKDNSKDNAIQRTYLKDAPQLTAKFSVAIVASTADAGSDIISNDWLGHADATTLLQAAMEAAILDVIAKDLAISVVSESEMRSKMGMEATTEEEATTAATPSNNNYSVYLYLTSGLVAKAEGRPTKSTATGLTGIQLTEFALRPRKGRNKKKPTDYEVAFKICVETTNDVLFDDNDNDMLATDLSTIPDDDWKQLSQPVIRLNAGRALYEILSKRHVKEPASDVAPTQPSTSAPTAAADSSTESAAADTAITDKDNDAMVVNVETVSGKIDYNRLVENFGSSLLTPEHLERLERCCRHGVKLHRFLRRGIFFSHRDLDLLLTVVEQHRVSGSSSAPPFYLYTGRGPSSESMHMGHLIPFLFTKWLQDAFDVPLVIQMTDDEKFIFKGTYSHEDGDNLTHFQRLTVENAKDIIACGFDSKKTFLFSDLDYVGRMYPNIVRIWKAATANTVNSMFGFDGSSNIGKLAFPAIQAAPAFASSFPIVLGAGRDGGDSGVEEQETTRNNDNMVCLIPCAIDQDPYFRLTRDVAHKLVTPPAMRGLRPPHPLGGKPALIHSKFFPPLQGAMGKMSSSDTNSAIFLTDSADEISRKIKQHAFSGGQDTKAKQVELGADLQVDVSYQWLRFFLEDDDELERIGRDYGSGSGDYWSTHKVKERLVQVCQELVAEHQARRAKVTDEDVKQWMRERSIVG